MRKCFLVIRKKEKGFTLLELMLVITIIGILGLVLMPVYGIAKETIADDATLIMLNNTTKMYSLGERIESDDIFEDIITDEARLQILVDKNYLENIPVPRRDESSFQWSIESQEWIISQSNNVGDIVFKSMVSLLNLFEDKTTVEIQNILGSNNISNDTYRAYILSHTFNGTWPSFPEELQAKVDNGSQLKVMPFSYSESPNDPVIYASTNTGNNWNAQYFYYQGKGWYRYKNQYGTYTGYTFSNKSGTALKEFIDATPNQWELVE